MKKILLLSFTILTTSPVIADQCLSASQITITKDSSGAFTVNLPKGSGYTYFGQNSINKTGPIIFAAGQVLMTLSNPNNKTGKTTEPISCIYGIDEVGTTGKYPGGIFYLTKDNSQNKTITLSESWFFNLNTFKCFDSTGQESTCSFTLFD